MDRTICAGEFIWPTRGFLPHNPELEVKAISFGVNGAKPRNGKSVLDLVEAGKVSASDALRLLRGIDFPRVPGANGRHSKPGGQKAHAVTPAPLSQGNNGWSHAPGTAGGISWQAPADPQDSRDAMVAAVIAELDALIGLRPVKKLVKEIHALVEIQRRRREVRLAAEPLALHMVFRGNPGTGKTTVARILGKLFHATGVLPRGQTVEVERADLVGEYIGHTAQRTREQLRRAMGGVLFVDEAYSLARGGEKDFGKEAIDVMVKAMEDHKEQLVIILAGYMDEMEMFLHVNPGLRSRFPIHIEFPDYATEELLQIADLMLYERQYQLSTGARLRLRTMLERKRAENSFTFGNARLVRNLVEKAIRCQAVRLVARKDADRDELILIREEDVRDL
ncbi:MAG: AAA family ATPase [Firmicutes bacterium]|nr:AAA family ATPase [Bacillota bacterium]